MIKLTDLLQEMITNTKIICDKCGHDNASSY